MRTEYNDDERYEERNDAKASWSILVALGLLITYGLVVEAVLPMAGWLGF